MTNDTAKNYGSWGNLFTPQQSILTLRSRHASLPHLDQSVLPYGLGRSYGDSCLNPDNTLLVTTALDKFISFDRDKGIIACEAGVSFRELLTHIVPEGWFLPVTPGTQFVTVGGAIANDVHGKNHHEKGTFGHHVLGLELVRSDGSRRWCTPHDHSDWFYATIGGLGLTGLITRAVFSLTPIHHEWIDKESIKFSNVDEFFDIATESDNGYEHTVAWLDCLASGRALGRGHFYRGNHAEAKDDQGMWQKRKKTFPFDAPNGLLNTASIMAFNQIFYHKQRKKHHRYFEHYQPFFYPLDNIHHWNRLYGNRGFYQYQCVVPCETTREPIRDILKAISSSGQGSFLGVLKLFGNKPSLGPLSFPRKGVTLALDFANKGENTLRLFNELDTIVKQAGGALYPAKDARMSPEMFRLSFPALSSWLPYKDPAFSSGFWRRVMDES